MKLSIIIPTYNNLDYLKFFLLSLKKNSLYDHEIILHINDGSDGTLKFADENHIRYTHSKFNIGLCSSMNRAYNIATSDYILYAHDDMFFCKNWDKFLIDGVNKLNDNLFYLAGINVSNGHGLINYDCGSSPNDFNENKFSKFCLEDKSGDLQSSHWAPHLIHRDLWNKIGGFSEEFNPGDGSDPDFCMKLWNEKVRIFKCISEFKVYHFNSKTTRNKKVVLNNGTKTFLLKYGFSPKFFRKYYLRGNISIINYIGKLPHPIKDINYFLDLIKCKLKIIYLKIFNI